MSDYEMPDVYEEKWRIAKKDHVCCECGLIIPVGARYQHVKGLWDGTWSKFKTCPNCDEQRHNYRLEVGEPPPFTLLRDWCHESDISFWTESVGEDKPCAA